MKKNDNISGHSFDKLTAEEQRKIAQAGGKASVEARRKKKELKEIFDMLLSKDFADNKGSTKSGAELIAMKQFEKALKGDTKAFEIVRDTAGQKPAERVMIAEVEQSVIDEVEAMVNEYDEETSS